MRFSPKRTQSVAVIVTCAVAIILLVVFVGYRIRRRVASDSADALSRSANELSWNGNCLSVVPLYRQAEIKFETQGNSAKALYAQVSQNSRPCRIYQSCRWYTEMASIWNVSGRLRSERIQKLE